MKKFFNYVFNTSLAEKWADFQQYRELSNSVKNAERQKNEKLESLIRYDLDGLHVGPNRPVCKERVCVTAMNEHVIVERNDCPQFNHGQICCDNKCHLYISNVDYHNACDRYNQVCTMRNMFWKNALTRAQRNI